MSRGLEKQSLKVLDFADVVGRLSDPAAQNTLSEAYQLARQLYGEQNTLSRLPRIQHTLHVTNTLLNYHVDTDTLCAALLYHTVRDDLDLVENICGKNVATMLHALRDLDIYTDHSANANQRTLEAVRRAAFSIIKGDVRVVLIRIVVALHTLQAAKYLPAERRRLIAEDVRNIYAPLANRLGIWTLKWELEDLTFRYLDPEKYKEIATGLAERREERNERIQTAKGILQQQLHQYNIDATVTGRSKHIYSIYKKMERKRVTLDQIFDAHALRIIIKQDAPEAPDLKETERKKTKYTQCYRALGIVHSIDGWRPITEEFDDYIQHPKPNGYSSLHTAVRDENDHTLEVQIRTQRMHDQAERGFAAHWAYKEAGGKPSAGLVRQVESLRSLLDAMDAGGSTAEPAADTPPEEDRVYVFTPGNDVIDLPKGATPVDFAYAVHTQVGHRCVGAKVNDKMVPLNYQLQSGDKISILTSSKDKPGRPNRDWMNENLGYTQSNRARSRIRQWFRTNEREHYLEVGRSIINRELKEAKAADISAADLADWHGESEDNYLSQVGFGDVKIASIQGTISFIQHARREVEPPPPLVEETPEQSRRTASSGKQGLTVMGMAGLATHFANCCNPIYPEPIMGYITRGRGIAIHGATCKQLGRLLDNDGERVIEEVAWGQQKDARYSVAFHIKAFRSDDILVRIATMLKGRNTKLLQTKIVQVKGDDMHVYILVEVTNNDDAEWIRTKLDRFTDVYEVSR